MKNYRTAAAALALALALSTPAAAGVIWAEKSSPTPTPAPMTAGMTADAPEDGGLIYTGEAEPASSASGSMIAEVAGVLLQSVLTLF